MFHNKKLKSNIGRAHLTTLFFSDEPGCSIQYPFQLSTDTVFLITFLCCSIKGNNHTVQTTIKGFSDILFSKIVTIRASGDIDIIMFSNLDKFEKIFIDKRFSLVIYQHEKDIFSHMLNYLLKGFKTHPTSSSFHFTGPGCTKRAVEITLIGRFDGQNRGSPPNNGFVQKSRDKKRN